MGPSADDDPAWYVEHADELRALLTGVLRRHDLVAEALQATFLRCLESGHQAHRDTARGWLFRVAMNEALQLKRKQSREAKSLEQIGRNGAAEADDSNHSPEIVVIRSETIEQVRAALDRLSEEQRRVVRMRIDDGRTFAEIAQELDLPLGTVLTRMRLAVEKLSRSLRDV